MSEEKDDIGAILNSSMDQIYDEVIGEETEAPEAPEPAEKPAVEVEEVEDVEEVEAAPAPVKAVKAPATWGKAVQEKFATLDPEVQSEILKREADQARGIQRYAEDAKYASTLRQIISPYEQLIRSEGGTPEAVLQGLLETAAALRTGTPQQKAQLLIQAAHTYGADLSGFIAQQQQLQQMPPEYRSLIERQQALEAEMARRDADQARHIAMQQQSEMGAAFDVVHSFASETDESGNLKYPHFDQLRPAMAQMLTGGLAEDLTDAYRKAEWSVPEIRQQLIEAEAAKKADELRRVQAQKAARVGVKPKGTYSTTGKPGTMEETMSAVYDSLTA